MKKILFIILIILCLGMVTTPRYGIHTLPMSAISDVYIDSIADNHILQWDSTDSRFENTIDPVFNTVTVTSYERHVIIPARVAGAPANSPTPASNYTVSGLKFSSALNNTTYCEWEIPDDWDGTDVYIEVDWYPDSGALPSPSVLRWNIQYRAIAEGELISNGTVVSLNTDYDSAVSGTVAQYETEHTKTTIEYDNANQPLTKQDHVYFMITRDVSVTNDFSGTVTVPSFEIVFNSTSLPTN